MVLMIKTKKQTVKNFIFLSFVAGASAFATTSFAASVTDACPDIQSCAKAVGELLGQKYIFDSEVKGKVQATPNLELTKDNAEVVFTNILYLEHFARVPNGAPNTYQIVRDREARDMPVPLLKATQTEAPKLPNTWDLITLSYKATNAEVVDEIARSARSFMPANSRIIPYEAGGNLFITDSAQNIKKIYEIIVSMDQKPSAALRKRWEEHDRAGRRERHSKNSTEAATEEKPKPMPPGAVH